MNNPTAWMIRMDGKVFSCRYHYYGDKDDVEETLYVAEWLYKHTTRYETKQLILNFISVYAEGLNYGGDIIRDLLLDINKKQYNFLTADFISGIADKLPSQVNMNICELNELVIKALNCEFLRARLGGMYDTVDGCKDMFFRISGDDLDWMPIIKNFVRKNSEHIDTVTVLWDYESMGKKDFFKDSRKRDINMIPVSEFI